jgi:hypothetical protein
LNLARLIEAQLDPMFGQLITLAAPLSISPTYVLGARAGIAAAAYA